MYNKTTQATETVLKHLNHLAKYCGKRVVVCGSMKSGLEEKSKHLENVIFIKSWGPKDALQKYATQREVDLDTAYRAIMTTVTLSSSGAIKEVRINELPYAWRYMVPSKDGAGFEMSMGTFKLMQQWCKGVVKGISSLGDLAAIAVESGYEIIMPHIYFREGAVESELKGSFEDDFAGKFPSLDTFSITLQDKETRNPPESIISDVVKDTTNSLLYLDAVGVVKAIYGKIDDTPKYWQMFRYSNGTAFVNTVNLSSWLNRLEKLGLEVEELRTKYFGKSDHFGLFAVRNDKTGELTVGVRSGQSVKKLPLTDINQVKKLLSCKTGGYNEKPSDLLELLEQDDSFKGCSLVDIYDAKVPEWFNIVRIIASKYDKTIDTLGKKLWIDLSFVKSKTYLLEEYATHFGLYLVGTVKEGVEIGHDIA